MAGSLGGWHHGPEHAAGGLTLHGETQLEPVSLHADRPEPGLVLRYATQASISADVSKLSGPAASIGCVVGHLGG